MRKQRFITRCTMAVGFVALTIGGAEIAPALGAPAAVADPSAVLALVGTLNGVIANLPPTASANVFQRALITAIHRSSATSPVILAALKQIKLQGNQAKGLNAALDALISIYSSMITGGIGTNGTNGLGNINNGAGDGPTVIGGGSTNYGSH